MLWPREDNAQACSLLRRAVLTGLDESPFAGYGVTRRVDLPHLCYGRLNSLVRASPSLRIAHRISIAVF